MKKIIILIVAFATISCSSQKGKISDDFDFGKTENGVYKNNYFNLEINFNPGWVVQDKEQMNLLKEAGSKMVAGEDKYLSKAIKAAYVNTAYLLSIFKIQ